MIVTQSAVQLQNSFQSLWYTVAQVLPPLIAAVAIFAIGWIVGMILARIVEQIAEVLRIDDALKAAGVDDAAREAGFSLNAGRFLGVLVQWFVVIVFLMTSLEILGFQRVTMFLQQVVLLYLPQVIVAALILILAAVVAEVVKNIVTGSARAAGAHSANLAGAVAKWAIWIFAVMAALDQLGVASSFVQTVFAGLVIALSLAFGLAFGLGGKEAAARTIERVRSEISHRKD